MKRSAIASSLLGAYIGSLRRAGFSEEDLLTALKGAVAGLTSIQSKGLRETINEVEAMMDKMGFQKVDEGEVGFDVYGKPQCNCPVCTARRHRGADRQDERNDV